MRPWFVIVALGACTGEEDSDTDVPADTDVVSEAVCEEAKEPSCVDAMILDLSLHDDETSDGDVTTEVDGADFVTRVDATAGGYSQASNNPWVYVRFTPTGAERVDIDDESALGSMDWHISARRFILRTNSGENAPSCVGVSSFPEKTYEELTSVPDGLQYYEDDFYTADCTIVNDSSGLPGSPQVALAPWWSYDACVATTSTPFVIRLEDGKFIKLVVEAYYEDPADQEVCNETGTAPTGAVSAYYQWRWRFLE